MALVVNDAADRVEQMILLTERLTELVAAGAQCFEERRPQDAMAFHDETARLANIYRHESTRVRANPTLVSRAPADQRQKLVRATEAFHAVLNRQGRAIDAARTVTEGLVKTIAEEVANQREQRSGYGPGALPPASAGRGATAITLNQRA